MNNDKMKVLLVDDDEEWFIIIRNLLEENRPGHHSLDWEADWDRALEKIGLSQHHLYLLDYQLGEKNGLELLKEAIADGCRAPIILFTGQGNRELDMAAMQAGAADYLNKNNISSELLERSIRYAIERKQAEDKRERLISELQDTLAKVKTLSGLLPICAACKKIRDDKGYWNQIEVYIRTHSEAEFSHGMCPGCAKKFYPDLTLYPDNDEN